MFQKIWRTVFGNWPMTKRNMFLVILLAVAITSAVFSLVTRVTVLDLNTSNPVKIAVVGPMSGPEQAIGDALRRGAELAALRANQNGGVSGHAVTVETFDDGNDVAKAADIARDIVAQGDFVSVVGHWAPEATASAEPVYAAAGLPMIVTAPAAPRAEGASGPVYRTVFDDLEQTRFLANYLRNVVGQETVSIIHADTERGRDLAAAFDATYRRFGTKVLNFWDYDPSDMAALPARAAAIAQEIRDRKLTGHIFIQGGAPQAARIAVALRAAKIRNGIVGLADLASSAFVSEVQAALPDGEPAASVTNGMFVTTPLLFDTATEVAQNFRSDYLAEYGTVPDWVAAYSFDAANLTVDALIDVLGTEAKSDQANIGDIATLHTAVQGFLNRFDHVERARRTVGGERYFGPNGANTTSVQIGLYNGSSMISALTQLQPILERGVTGFLDLVQAGKVLYVNDRFMYKTNVVYTGVQLLNVEQVREGQGEDSRVLGDRYRVDFLVWFRYRGNFEPQDVVFVNAVEPIKLTEPDKTGTDGDLNYASYRVSGEFKLEFSDIKHPYGTVLTGLGFHHRLLSRNNLMYVTDVLGMGLAKARNETVVSARQEQGDNEIAEEAESWLKMFGIDEIDLGALFSQGPSGDPLLDGLSERRVFASMPEYVPERSWISQEVYEGTGEGDPSFIGYGKQAPEFTRIDMGVILAPAGVDPSDAIPYNWFVYLLIFAVVILAFAAIMDRKDRGQFWRVQTLGMRVIGWPILLVSASTLLLDYSAQNLPDAVTDALVMLFDSLWWLVPARLLAITVERFFWVPIEEKSGRRIPNVVRLFAGGSIYLLAVFGVIAFVFDQRLTSLLATSGLLATIIGLAIHANIANIFSGIVLNIERPFKVGDWVQVDETIGQVTDITWRTMRLCTRDGYHISIPNGVVSESLIENFSTGEMVRFSAEFFVPERYLPDQVEQSIRNAEERVRAVLRKALQRDDALDDYTWRYDGVKVFELGLFHRYRVDFWIDEYNDFEIVRDVVYAEVFRQFGIDGIEQGPAPTDINLHRPKSSAPGTDKAAE